MLVCMRVCVCTCVYVCVCVCVCVCADAIASSIISSGAGIDPKTAKILARLNLRRQRENEDCTHAWRDWEPPADAADKQEVVHRGEGREEEEEMGGEETIISSSSSGGGGGASSKSNGSDNYSDKFESIFNSLDVNDANNDGKKSANVGIPTVPIKSKKGSSANSSGLTNSEQRNEKKKKEKENAKSKKSDFMKMMKAL